MWGLAPGPADSRPLPGLTPGQALWVAERSLRPRPNRGPPRWPQGQGGQLAGSLAPGDVAEARPGPRAARPRPSPPAAGRLPPPEEGGKSVRTPRHLCPGPLSATTLLCDLGRVPVSLWALMSLSIKRVSGDPSLRSEAATGTAGGRGGEEEGDGEVGAHRGGERSLWRSRRPHPRAPSNGCGPRRSGRFFIARGGKVRISLSKLPSARGAIMP